jgi:intein/homing endonuclease
MKLTKEFSEVIGMFAADGCMQKDYICMWGNINEDKNYYDNIVCPLFSLISNKQIKAHEKKSNSVYGFYICDKSIIQIFRELGFINNKTYNVDVPSIIKESDDKEILSAFIRGFSDCDGNINFLKRKVKHTVHVKKTKKSNEKNQLKISVRGVERVEDWMLKIGLNNPAQFTKYLVWKKFGFCPPRITIQQRKQILAGEIDPKQFYKI